MDALYNIFIIPLIYILEILIHILNPLLSLNPILAIFIISFTVNFLSYPVFAQIEKMIKKDNEDYQKLLPKVNSIKRNFSGYEQRMLLATYFRQNNYHPLLAHFKQSLTIFLQVPIFIASYVVVCDSFLFQAPLLDQINNSINLFGLPIKILPIFMTIINMLSVRVYMKDKSFSNKLYANSLSILFLVLLYFSPASIVLYWIFNNSFAFLRNIYFYNKNKMLPTLLVYIISVIVLAFFVTPQLSTLYAIIILILISAFCKFIKYVLRDTFYTTNFILFLVIYVVMDALNYLPAFGNIINYISAVLLFTISILCYKSFLKNNCETIATRDFILLQLPIVLIFGFYIPLKLINSSILEYYQLIDVKELVSHVFEVCIGLFLIYPTIIFYVQKRYRLVICYISMLVLSIVLKTLYTESLPSDTINVYAQFSLIGNIKLSSPMILSISYIIATIVLVALIFKFKLMKYVKILVISLICVYIYNISKEVIILKNNVSDLQKRDSIKHRLSLSSKGKNVLVILLDRAISGFLPQIMAEKPEFKQTFTGFTYYPYTVSFAVQTLYSTPSLFGGYEYTPLKIQQDTTRSIVDKHNEAISVIPEILRNNGYNVTLYDMPYINYDNKKAKRFYHEDINIINREHLIDRRDNVVKLIKKNTFYFILFRMTPNIYKNKVYNQGMYFEKIKKDDIRNFKIKSEYKHFETFIDSLTINDKDNNYYIFFNSLITHSPAHLTKDYGFNTKEETEVKEQTEVKDSKTINHVLHYNVNMLAYMEVEKLLKKLKDSNAYDNTRIIIMSDHGWPIEDVDNVNKEITPNNSLLFVKDFNATGEYTTNYEFMTTADIPYLTVKDIDSNLINPMTNKKLLPQKDKGVDVITNHLIKWAPAHFEEKERTYLYDEEANYMHVDEKTIKDLIQIENKKGN